jgi:hypothetical protein
MESAFFGATEKWQKKIRVEITGSVGIADSTKPTAMD